MANKAYKNLNCKGYTVMSVTKICADGSSPRVAVKSTPAYMRAIRKLLS